jgi:glutamine amidotransferase
METNHKVPHTGFSEIYGHKPVGLFRGLGHKAYFYFTHSYAIFEEDTNLYNLSLCNHAKQFVAAFQDGIISGVQFHPEKSQSAGLRLIYNFLSNNDSLIGNM